MLEMVSADNTSLPVSAVQQETTASVLIWNTLCLLLLLWFVPRAVKYIWHLVIISSVPRNLEVSQLPLPPGTFGYPFVGETLAFLREGAGFYKQKLLKYGKVYKTHLLGVPFIRVVGAENVRKILLGENKIVTQQWPASVKHLLGKGATSQSSGEIHATRRHKLTHAFSSNALDEYVPMIQGIVRNMIGQWCNSNGHLLGYDECRRMAITVSLGCLVGFNLQKEEVVHLTDLFHVFFANIMTLPLDIPGTGFNKAMKARREIITMIRKQIDRCEEEKELKTALDFLKATHDLTAITEEEKSDLADGALDLIFAGHDSTSSAMCSALLLLGKHRHVLEKVREELSNHGLLTGINDDDDDGLCDLDRRTLRSLVHVNNVIKEVLRLLPPVGAGFRRVLESFELDGYHIPKGWTLVYSIRETHEISPLFDDNVKFNPDRWSNMAGSAGDMHLNADDSRYQYVPFSGGVRGCPGKEFAKLFLQIFLVEVARSCDWKIYNENAKIKHIPAPHPVDLLPISFTRHNITG